MFSTSSDGRDRLGQQRLGAGEGEQAAGQRGGAGRALHRIVEVELDLAARAVQLAPGEIEAADDDREHVVEIVGDAAGELADRLHLLDLAELRLGGGALGRLGLEPLVGVAELARCAPAPPARARSARRASLSASRRALEPLDEGAVGEEGEPDRAEADQDGEPAEPVGIGCRPVDEPLRSPPSAARRSVALGRGDLLELARAAPAASAIEAGLVEGS